MRITKAMLPLLQLRSTLLQQAALRDPQKSRSHTKKGPGRMPHRKTPPFRLTKEGWEPSSRLRAARGAGTIHAESDMQQLVRAGLHTEAASLFVLHNRMRGVPNMRWGNLWYLQYRGMR